MNTSGAGRGLFEHF